ALCFGAFPGGVPSPRLSASRGSRVEAVEHQPRALSNLALTIQVWPSPGNPRPERPRTLESPSLRAPRSGLQPARGQAPRSNLPPSRPSTAGGCRVAQPDNQLAEIPPLQQPDKGGRRVVDPVDDVLAVFERAGAHQGRGHRQVFRAQRGMVADDKALDLETLAHRRDEA